VKKGTLRAEFDIIFSSIIDNTFDCSVFKLPNIIYSITQPSKSGKLKQRIVFCPPFAVTILELMFYSLLCDFFTRNSNTSIFMGFGQIDLFNLNKDNVASNKSSGDYSSFDQSLPSVFICAALFIFSLMIDFSSSERGSSSSDYYYDLF